MQNSTIRNPITLKQQHMAFRIFSQVRKHFVQGRVSTVSVATTSSKRQMPDFLLAVHKGKIHYVGAYCVAWSSTNLHRGTNNYRNLG